MSQWVEDLATDDDQSRLEALWAYQTLDVLNPMLLDRLLSSKDGRIRAAAARVVYHWHRRLADPMALLEPLVVDAHPRVRLEAVRALSRLSDPHACQVAMRALDLPQDQFLQFCLWTTARDLEPIWMSALRRGEIDFDGNASHLTFALQAIESSDAVPILTELLNSGRLDPQRSINVLKVLARLGDAPQLRDVLKRAFDQGVSGQQRMELLNALLDAKRQHNVTPAGDLTFVKARLGDDHLGSVASLIQAVGAWRITALGDEIVAIATDEAQPAVLRSQAMQALSELGGDQGRDALVMLGRKADPPLQVQAVSALIRLDPDAGTQLLAKQLLQVQGIDPTLAIQSTLSQKGAADLLVDQLSDTTISRDAAMLALRTVGSSGQSMPRLDAALRKAGQVTDARWQFSATERDELLAEVAANGDAARGEQVFRRESLNCQKCHAIGGAGGNVGPDMVSIGASAQPDYLLESLLEPNKKIKENYHSLILETDDGKIVTGIKLRETDTDLILRNADDQIVAVPLNKIEDRADGGSLMPESLMESLTRTELVDLVRFLSELGKVGGSYSVSNVPYVRSWRVLNSTPENSDVLRAIGIEQAADAGNRLDWRPCYSLVSGTLPIADLPTNIVGSNDQRILLQFDLKADRPRRYELQLNDTRGLTMWLNSDRLEIAEAVDP